MTRIPKSSCRQPTSDYRSPVGVGRYDKHTKLVCRQLGIPLGPLDALTKSQFFAHPVDRIPFNKWNVDILKEISLLPTRGREEFGFRRMTPYATNLCNWIEAVVRKFPEGIKPHMTATKLERAVVPRSDKLDSLYAVKGEFYSDHSCRSSVLGETYELSDRIRNRGQEFETLILRPCDGEFKSIIRKQRVADPRVALNRLKRFFGPVCRLAPFSFLLKVSLSTGLNYRLLLALLRFRVMWIRKAPNLISHIVQFTKKRFHSNVLRHISKLFPKYDTSLEERLPDFMSLPDPRFRSVKSVPGHLVKWTSIPVYRAAPTRKQVNKLLPIEPGYKCFDSGCTMGHYATRNRSLLGVHVPAELCVTNPLPLRDYTRVRGTACSTFNTVER